MELFTVDGILRDEVGVACGESNLLDLIAAGAVPNMFFYYEDHGGDIGQRVMRAPSPADGVRICVASMIHCHRSHGSQLCSAPSLKGRASTRGLPSSAGNASIQQAPCHGWVIWKMMPLESISSIRGINEV